MIHDGVTIIIATYDRPDWLAVSLRSVQTAAAFARLHGTLTRILVIDDGSPTSSTEEVCRAFSVDYHQNRDPDGRNDPSAARVLGLAMVDTEYCAFFDDDDVMLPRSIAARVDLMRAGADVAYSGYVIVDANLKPIRRSRPLPARMGDLLLNHNAVEDHAMQRTAVLDGVWRADLEKAMIFGGWLELQYRGANFVRLDEPTYLYRRHDANMSDQPDERFQALRLELITTYQRRLLERDGRLPRPSFGISVRQRIGPRAHAALRSFRDRLLKARG